MRQSSRLGSGAMQIFVNYRRRDAESAVGHITDRLRMAFGFAEVYRDIGSIPPGAEFARNINRALEKCDCFICMIGPNWLTPRLTNEEDWVRHEIEAALARGIPIIPILIEGAKQPERVSLPPSLAPLLDRQALEIDSGLDFDVHLDRLVVAINYARSGPRSSVPPPEMRPSRYFGRGRLGNRWALRRGQAGTLLGAAMLTTIFCISFQSLFRTPPNVGGVLMFYVMCGTLIWAGRSLLLRARKARR